MSEIISEVYNMTDTTSDATTVSEMTSDESETTSDWPIASKMTTDGSTLSEMTSDLSTGVEMVSDAFTMSPMTTDGSTGLEITSEVTSDDSISDASTELELTTDPFMVSESVITTSKVFPTSKASTSDYYPTTKNPITDPSLSPENLSFESSSPKESTSETSFTSEMLTQESFSTSEVPTELSTVQTNTYEGTDPFSELPTAENSTSEDPIIVSFTSEVSPSSLPTTDFPPSESSTSKLLTSDSSTVEWETSESSTNEMLTSEYSTTEVPSFESSTPEMSTSESSSTEMQPSESSSTQMPTSESSATEISTSESSTSEMPISESPTTEISTSESSTTEMQTSESSTTKMPSSESSTNEMQTSESTPFEVKTSTTEVPSSESSSTEMQPSESSSTQMPTSESSSTEMSISESSATEISTSESSTTEMLTSESSTTEMPISESPTTEISTSESSTTEMQTSESSTTKMPSSESSTNEMQTSESTPFEVKTSTTEVPSSESSSTEMQPSESSSTQMPTSESSSTEMSISESSATEISTSESSTTEMLTSESSTTEMPISESPTTEISTSESSTTKMQTSESSTTEMQTSESTTFEVKTSESYECSDGDGFFANEDDCSSYFQCYQGISYKKFCSVGLYYNPSKRTCDTENTCGAEIINPTARNLDIECDCENCLYPDADNCQKYYLCLGGIAYDEYCNNGLLFNPQTSTCDYEDVVGCSQPSTECGTLGNGDVSIAGKCGNYMHCVAGVAYEKKCPVGLHFGEDSGRCEDPCEAGCDPTIDCSANVTTTTKSAICEDPNGFYPNPKDCRTFYKCNRGFPTLALCVENEHFNPVEKICQEPCQAMCNLTIDCPNKTSLTTKEITLPSTTLETTTNIFTDKTTDHTTPDETFATSITTQTEVTSTESTTTSEESSTLTDINGTTKRSTTKIDGTTKEVSTTVDEPTKESTTTVDEPTKEPTTIVDEVPTTSEDIPTTEDPFTITSTSLPASKDDLMISTEGTTLTTSTGPEVTPEEVMCKHPNGVYPKAGDCNAFYLCILGHPHIMSCGNMHFSSVSKHCERPCNAQCDPTLDCSTKEEPESSSHVPMTFCTKRDVVPKPGHCDYYYDCTSGIKQKHKCPRGLEFNPSKRACDIPRIAGCGEPQRQLPRPDIYYKCECEDCLVPSHQSCIEYFLCLNRTAYRMRCSGGLLFDKELNTCNYASEVNCDDDDSAEASTAGRPTRPPSSSTRPPKPTTRPPSSSTRPPKPTTKPPISSTKPTHPTTTVPPSYTPTTKHPKITTQQDDQQASTVRPTMTPRPTIRPTVTPTPTIRPTRTPTVRPTTTPTVRPTTTVRPTVTPRPTPTRRPTADDQTVSPSPKHHRCQRPNGMFRNPDDCGKFIHCANWWPYVMNCPEGLHFNPETMVCDYPCEAKCDKSLHCETTAHPTTTPIPRDPICSCTSCLLPNPESCTKYYSCDHDGQSSTRTCPRGQTFDSNRHVCDWAHRVDCDSSEACPRRNGLFPVKGACHKFVHCANGIPYVKECPANLHFNPVGKRCEWPSGKCEPSDPSEDNKPTPSPTPEPEWECPKSFGFFRSEDSCSKFYICSKGEAQLMECPKDLVFNSKYQTCDWPQNVNCHKDERHYQRRCRRFDRQAKCPPNRQSLPHPHCDMFFDCSVGKACAKRCPDGLYFNNQTAMCDLPDNVRCRKRDGSQYSLKNFANQCRQTMKGQMTDPAMESCYYRCQRTRVVRGCCAKNRVFNEQKDVCEWKKGSGIH